MNVYIKARKSLPSAGEKMAMVLFSFLLLCCGEKEAGQLSAEPAPYPVIEIERRTVEDVVRYPAESKSNL
jgi:hypothetical protein